MSIANHPTVSEPGETTLTASDRATRNWATILHLSMLAGYLVPLAGLIVPIVIWQVKKPALPELDRHGKNAANWIISELLYAVVCLFLVFAMIGIPLLVLLCLLGIIFPVMACIKASNGVVWKYPLSISFFK
jgi:uncharacterized Tic20 family protein